MEDKDNNWKAMLAVALVSVAAAVGVTLAVTSGDDDDDGTAEIAQAASFADDAAATAPADTAPVVDMDDSDDVNDTPDPVTDPDDQPISDSEANHVSKAALVIAGGGTVTDLDRSDDPGEAWEVEVTTDDGSELDVALDENLNRVENTPYDD